MDGPHNGLSPDGLSVPHPVSNSPFPGSDHLQGPAETRQHLGLPRLGPRLHTLLLCVSPAVSTLRHLRGPHGTPFTPFSTSRYEDGQVGDANINTQDPKIQKEIMRVIGTQVYTN